VNALSQPEDTMPPGRYESLRDIPAALQPVDDGFTATFFDANISTSGETEEEALSNLRSLIIDIFESLESEPPDRLGPEPKRQLELLRVFIRRI
jgi:predicted RNase H-like HicB family nuclease